MGIAKPLDLRSKLARIRRRWVMLRLLEHTGMGLLIGCGLSLPLTALLLWQGEQTWGLMGAIACLSLLMGALAGWIRRPGMFDTAVEADRQLRLNELLSTALLLEHSPRNHATDESFRDVILQLARQRCESLAENQLVLRRWGTRAWSTLALTVLLSLALAMLAGNPLIVRAGKVRAGDGGSSDSFPHSTPHRWVARDNQTAPKQGFDRRSGESPSRQSDQSHSDRGGSVAGASATDSTGEQSARGSQALVERARQGSQNITEPSQHGAPSAGNGTSTSLGMAGENISQSVATRRIAPRSAPWERDGWDHARAQALHDAGADDFPAAYRDLVRDYFTK